MKTLKLISILKSRFPFWRETFVLSFFLWGGLQGNAQDNLVDVSLKNVKVSPLKAMPGKDTLLLNAQIITSNLKETFTVLEVYLSSDTVISIDDRNIAYDYVDTSSKPIYRSYKTITPYLKPGTNYAIFRVEGWQAVAETNEGNNIAIVPFEVLPGEVDLAFTSWDFGWIPSDLAPGSETQINYALQRFGYVEPDSIKIGYYLSKDSIFDPANDLFLKYNKYPPAFHNNDFSYMNDSITIPEEVELGSYYVIINLDNDKTIKEFNEFNNIQKVPTSINTPSVDLSIVYAYGNLNETNSYLHTHYWISNSGNSSIKKSSTGIFLSTDYALDDKDVLLGASNTGELFQGSQKDFRDSILVPSIYARGYYHLIFVADYNNENSETIEDNNYYSNYIFLPGPPAPDLRGEPAPGTQKITMENYFYYNTYIENYGDVTSDSTTVSFQLLSSTGEYLYHLGATPIGKLAPGEIERQSIFVYLPHEGVFYISTTVDPSSVVIEKDEFNNSFNEKVVYFNNSTLTGTEEGQNELTFTVSPNPAQENFSILNDSGDNKTTYVLYNQLGEAVRTLKNTHVSGPISFNCNGLAKGIYILKADSDGKVKQKKVILF